MSRAHVDLYWLPLGAGGSAVVRWSGRVYEAVAARRDHRAACDLYHSALEVRADADRFVIEMAPVWSSRRPDRGVVGEGAVGLAWLGRSRMFRYEIRRWLGGDIPDRAEAVASPQRLSSDLVTARRVLDLVPAVPTRTWGRDELGTGGMWNSNSLIAWLLTRSGHRMDRIVPPAGGRAPGWTAGVLAATRLPRLRPEPVAGTVE
jgi:hypothetical protein